MPIDAYSYCFCGLGKKIKFCCPDLLGDYEKLEKMLEGRQFAAAGNLLDELLKTHPNHPGLLIIRGVILRNEQKVEEMIANADLLLAEHPDNASALTEAALVKGLTGDVHTALLSLLKAVTKIVEAIPFTLFDATTTVAESLVRAGHWFTARELLRFFAMLFPQGSDETDQLIKMMLHLNRSPEVPLLMKDEQILPAPSAAEDAQMKEDKELDDACREVFGTIGKANWREGIEKTNELLEKYENNTLLLHILATTHLALTETPEAANAYQRMAYALEKEGDFTRAAGMLTISRLLMQDPLGDLDAGVALTWTVNDVEAISLAIPLSKKADLIPFTPQQWDTETNGPPPKTVAWLLDKPACDSIENITFADIPTRVCQLLVFGKQTDREARVEARGLSATEVIDVKTLVEELCGDAITGDMSQEQVGKMSKLVTLLEPNWHQPMGLEAEQISDLITAHYRDALLNRWPNTKMGFLGNKTIAEQAASDECKLEVAVVLNITEEILGHQTLDFDMDEVREKFNSPVQQPIEPDEKDLEHIPLMQLYYVNIDKLSDNGLSHLFAKSNMFAVERAVLKFAEAIIARDTLKGSPERNNAWRVIVKAKRLPEEKFAALEQGSKEFSEAKPDESNVDWDFIEVQLARGVGDFGRLEKVIGHIIAEHQNEPGVMQSLQQLLMQLGLVNQDGTPMGSMPGGEPPMGGMPGGGPQPEAEPGTGDGVWTPDSTPPPAAGGGEKIWTPDS